VTIDLGDGLRLALLCSADAEPLADAIRGDVDLLVRWVPHIAQLRSAAKVRSHLRRTAPYVARRSWLDLTIRLDAAIVGFISLYGVDRLDRMAMVGYWVSNSHTRRGIATRALTALCEFAFGDYGLHRLELHIAVDNQASRAVAERAGFQMEGALRGRFAREVGYADGALYARVRDDAVGQS
jgi:ribosomal-protein-serine acetyltransferase